MRERLIDMYAARIGMDPIDLRRKNLIRRDGMPYERKTIEHVPSIVLDEGDLQQLFETVVSKLGVAEVEARRAAGETVGFGVSTFFERSGTGPFERGAVEIDAAGSVTVRSGASSVGQGLRTVLTQIVAGVLDVSHDRIDVELLDTEKVDAGVGSFASRSTMTAGAAVLQAAQALLEDARRAAAGILGASTDDCTYAAGTFASGDATVSLTEVARRAGGLEAESEFKVAGPIYDCGAHGAVVRVDPETGAPTIERLVIGFDVGKAINPKMVEGQFVGAAAQGVGGAILEELPFDEHGNPLVTSLMDYRMPTMSEVPQIDTVIDESHPTDHNPLGAKGAGEGGITGVPAAVANAIAHALNDQERVTRIPVDPAQLKSELPTGPQEPLKEMLG